MAGIDGGISGEGQDFFSDAGQKLSTVPARQIPTADTVGKEDVPAKKPVFRRKIKTEASRAVPWDEEESGTGPCFRQRAGFLEELCGTDWTEALGQTEGEHGIRLEAEKRSVGVVVDRASGPLGKVGRVPDVIPVAVGEKQRIRPDLLFFEEIEKALGGIHREAVAVPIHHVSVGGGQAARKDQGFRHRSSFLRPFVYVYDYV